MMRTKSFFILILVISLALSASCSTSESKEKRSDGGGTKCAACTVVFQLVFNLMVVDNSTFDAALINLCTLLPEPYSTPCILFAEEFGEELLVIVGEGASSDDICQGLGICSNQTCRLFPYSSSLPYKYITSKNLSSSMSVWTWLYDIIYRFANEHLPLADFDGDKFSAAFETLRGSDWRGQDCNGFNDEIYPGRDSSNYPPTIDHDCNGIAGRDHLGRSYEDLLCGDSDRRGYIGLGDSATAHFAIPPQYLNASEITRTTFDHLLFILENELDWPHRSWGTGHLNDTTGDCPGPLDSIYLNLYERNRCNFRDYQNVGVNGARTGSMAPPGIVNSMARNQTSDHPALVFYALIGNDVCHGQPSFDVMTTPSEFKQNVLNALDYLNSTVPAGSFVVFLGLAEGEILWNTMWNRTHPIGCTYEDVYDFLNCLEISPCWGWLNSDPEVRARTGLRARELSLVYPEIIANYQYANFEMAYYPFPLPKAIEFWTSHGGQVWELIEPVDGFHPSQQANAVLAQVIVDEILKDHPEFLGAVNPNNEQIKSLFGDQGGY